MTIKHKITFPPEVHHRAAMSRFDDPFDRALEALEVNQHYRMSSALDVFDALAAAVAEHAIIEPVPPTPITCDQIVEGMTVVVTSDGWTRTAQADHQDADGDWLDADGNWIANRDHHAYATYDEPPAPPAERMAAALGVEPGAIRQALTDAGLDLSEWKP